MLGKETQLNRPAPGIAGPVDLEALALHVVSLSGELERAWSRALDAVSLEKAQGELNTEMGALVTAMNGAVEETEEKLSAAGFDPKMYTWPYDPNVFKGLVPSTDLEARRGQLAVAQMIALREVLEAFKALQEPSGLKVNLVDRSRTEWFEAGAFSLFRHRANLLLRITREVDRTTDELLTGEEVAKLDLSIESAFESAKAAEDANSRGDLDAALLHCRAALRGVLESLPFVRHDDKRLSHPEALLAVVPSLSEYGSALRLLDAEVTALGFRRADLGVAVPLIVGLLPVITAIVQGPPIVELQQIIAVGDGEE